MKDDFFEFFKKYKHAIRKIIVEYYDNGIGVNLDQPFSKNGLRNVENRIKEIKGTYDGNFAHGEKDGNGTYYYNSGLKYVG